MNDLFDSTTGLDKADYPRAMYSPHPVLEGYITKRGLATAAIVVNLVDAGVGVVLFMARGWPVIAFALAGFLLSAAYTAPPLRLKKRGLGEPDVFVVWGPLMVGGVYYSAVGSIPWEVYAASVPYGLLCTTVLMGKHVDKAPWDEREGIRTLPVILGDTRALAVTRGMMAGFYVTAVVGVAIGALPWPVVVVALGLPDPGQGVGADVGAQAGRAAEGLPHLAALVRRHRLPPHPAGGRCSSSSAWPSPPWPASNRASCADRRAGRGI